jgi:hypothetical protein
VEETIMAENRFPRAALLSVLPLWGVLLLSGCPVSSQIGNACTLAAPPGSAGQVTISTPALECDGQICLQVGTASPLCTSACNSDDDCRNLVSSSGNLCRRGFVCQAASAFGDHPCQRLCVCQDALPPEASCAAVP